MKTFLSLFPMLYFRKALTFTLKFLIFGVVSTAIVQVCKAQSWKNVSTDGFSAGGVAYTSLAINATSGTPYVAYLDGA